MAVTNKQKIGNYFKKDNIFLATVSCTEKNVQNGIDRDVLKKFAEAGLNFIEGGEMYDIFYKDGDAYLRFFAECVEKYVGDNSDGMGVLRNIVPVWDYFSEDELFEAQLDDGTMAIGFTNWAPLEKYNHEQNFGYSDSENVTIS